MLKNLFLIALQSLILRAYAQPNALKNMSGRWETTTKSTAGDLIFVNDSVAAFASPAGFVHYYINYMPTVKKNVILLKYTIDIHRKKNPRYNYAEIKFLNDSTMLLKRNNIVNPPNIDTNTRNVKIYKKIKAERPGTQLRLLTYEGLIGNWHPYFDKDPNSIELKFIDASHATYKLDKNLAEVTYIADFTQQPIPIDFYSPGSKKTTQAFLMLSDDDTLQIELFPKNNREDHFTFFGQNRLYIRQK